MAGQIDAETLRTWLEEQRLVTVVDIRTDDARAQWSIPGSVHVNAYDDLREGRPGALAHTTLPHDRPVVTVCNAGRVSQTAADLLARRGIDAVSLTGGMKAWNLAWNTADLPLSNTSAHVIQVRRTGKGCLSYVIGSEGDAAVLDPSLAPEVYLDLATQYNWQIRYVLETHIHADHLSRARLLAERSRATLLLPDQGRVHFPFSAVREGDRIMVGRATITARRTPGHTDESTTYLLNDAAVFTGDTLFTGGVGRPDLKADAEGTRQRAHALFSSVTMLKHLGPEMLVLPAHTSEPTAFDGRPVAARMADVNAWLSGWLTSEEEFIERVISRLPETPPNFARIVELNEAGMLPAGDPTELEAGANRCAVVG
jgi:glyoxylase-like metal-dependent hydrolase (beta-lactamase superfamily II)/rhodanese-related sulfurtransferase